MVGFVFAKQIAVYLTEELTADGRVSNLFPIGDESFIARAEAGLQNEW
jgi:hypothetical protein